jgi:hypothetical protein
MYIVLGQPLLDSGIHDSLLSSHFHHFRDGFWGIDLRELDDTMDGGPKTALSARPKTRDGELSS